MSDPGSPQFVDTNILIHAHDLSPGKSTPAPVS